MKNQEHKEYITTKQASDLLGLTEYTIRKKIKNNDIKAVPGANVRDGYKIDLESVYDYASKNKIAIAVGAGAAMAAMSAIPKVVPVIGAVTGTAVGAIGTGIVGLLKGLGLMDGENESSIKGKDELYKLGIQRLETEIDGLNLQIQSLELGEDSLEKDKSIIELKIKINELKKKIQEIEMQKALI